MWYIIAVVWLVLMFPLARDVDKQMYESNPDGRFNVLMNLIIFARTIIAMPIFYIMIIKNLFTRKK
jgi:hypothetical protein